MIKSHKLEQGYFYHIYNRGNNSEVLFKEKDNYIYFLQLLRKYISPIADVYCYCLLNNHFHLLIRVKENQLGISEKNPGQMFSNFFNSYTKHLTKNTTELENYLRKDLKGKK